MGSYAVLERIRKIVFHRSQNHGSQDEEDVLRSEANLVWGLR